jgi:hypothetical protein
LALALGPAPAASAGAAAASCTTACATTRSGCSLLRATCSIACVICWRVRSLSAAKLGSSRSTRSERLTGSIRSTHSTWPIMRNVVMMLPTVRLAAAWAVCACSTSSGPLGQFASVQANSGGRPRAALGRQPLP